MPSTLQGLAEYREEIRKSRFHTIAAPVADEDEAQAFIAAPRDASAGHNCWAWKCGAQYRFSDDGEPGGSAGRPILAAIEGQDMDCVAVLVSRWFGGIKLGTGGLARAYGGGAAKCLQQAPRSELVERCRVRFACAFADHALLKARSLALGASVAAEDYGADGVVLTLELPVARFEARQALLVDLSRGQVRPQRLDA
ncbi:YigZ family protein [Pseudomonas aeruginosa]|nr:YigZ family protein [Pseudomonas aeruginosa]